MLSSPWSLRITVIHVPRPGVVGGRKEFCSRAIPGPGPSQNSALSGTPAPKVQGTYAVRDVLAFSLAFNVGEAQASCRLHALPLWTKRPRQSRALIVIAPVLGRSAAKDQAVGGTASLVFVVSTPRYGFAVFIPARYSSTPPPW